MNSLMLLIFWIYCYRTLAVSNAIDMRRQAAGRTSIPNSHIAEHTALFAPDNPSLIF
jgi:hypothetical protein